jgi:cytochrome b involved in lipid metabolism
MFCFGDHPGSSKAILLCAGKDATEEFNMMHKRNINPEV